jgi:hypothetical protein
MEFKSMKGLLIVLLTFALRASAQNLQVETNWWQPNGKINTVLNDTTNNLLYVGGKFDYVGPSSPFGNEINHYNGLINTNFPKPNGKIKAAVSDGKGGWFIGGEFTKVGEFNRNRIAHINSLGNVSDFFDKKGFNKTVNSISLLNNVLYIGGNFNGYGETKSFGTVFNYSSETVKTTAPVPNATVRTSISDGEGGWFIGGDFTMIGDSLRNRIAHIDSLGQVKATFGNNGFNSTVTSLVLNNQTLYVGGNFSGYGVLKKNGGVINLLNKTALEKFEEPNGKVRAVVADGQGGWYIAGEFTKIGNTNRNYLAQLDSNGKVTNWNPNPNLPVLSLLLDSNLLFVGGLFTNIAAQNRNRLVAFNVANGSITSWDPNVNTDGITCMASNANTLFVGGKFTSIGSNSRNNLGAIDKLTGNVTALSISTNNTINDMALDGNDLYIAGDFTTVNSISRNYLAKIDINSNILTNWNPSPNGSLKSIAVKDSMVYIGGLFYSVGLPSRNLFAGINKITGIANSINITDFNSFDDFCIVGNNLYLAGRTSITGALYKIDLTNGVIDIDKISYTGAIMAMGSKDNQLYVGGTALTFGGVIKNRLASINILNQEISNWSPNVSGKINAMTISGNNLYIGGDFTGVNLTSRARLASFNINTGNLNGWNPTADKSINALSFSNNQVIIGGEFLSINSTIKRYIAGVDTLSGNLTNWNPDYTWSVNALIVKQNMVYVGGTAGIAAFNGSTGLKASWSPQATTLNVLSLSIIDNTIYAGCSYVEQFQTNNLNLGRVVGYNIITGGKLNYNLESDGEVYTIAANNNSIYVGGSFLNIGAKLCSKVAAINLLTGDLISFPININNEVLTIATNSNSIFVGGNFDRVNGANRRYAASFSIIDGTLQAWNPDATGKVFTIVISGNLAYVGGSFNGIGTQARNNIAELNLTDGKATTWNADADNSVFCLAINNGVMYAGGQFSNIGGQTCYNLAAINLSTSRALSWNPMTDGKVYALSLTNTMVYVGGSFNNIAGVNRKSIASFDLTNNRSLIYDYSADDTVFCLAASTKSLFVGGTFTSVGGKYREHLAVYNTNNGQLTNWKLNSIGGSSSAEIKTLILKNEQLFIGGNFSGVNGTSAEDICAINILTNAVTVWPYRFNSTINTMAIFNDTIYLGGDFTQINSITQNRLAAFTISTLTKLAWNPNVNNTVNDMIIYNNNLYVAGEFTIVGSQNRNNLAAFNLLTNNINTWNPNANGSVRTITQKNNQLFVGGDFTAIGSAVRPKLAAISATTSLANSWNPTANGRVNSIVFNDSLAYIGGVFNQLGGQTRNKLGSVNLYSGVLDNWNPDIDINVNDLVFSSKSLFVGSEFNERKIMVYSFNKMCANTINTTITTLDSFNFCEGKSALLFPTTASNYNYQWYKNGSSIPNAIDSVLIVNSNGTYSLVLTNYPGCRNESNKITFNLSPKPIIYEIFSNLAPINNTIVKYNVIQNAGSTYQWFVNNANQDSLSTSYLLSVLWKNVGPNKVEVIEKNVLGCVSDTASKIVQVLPETLQFSVDTLRFNLSSFYKTITVNTNTSWIGSPAESWLSLGPASGKGTTATVITVQPNNGKQRLSYINFVAGSLNKKLVVIQEGPVGLLEQNMLDAISVSPNPTNGLIQINNQSKQNIEIEITNISGQTVFKNQTVFAQNIVDINLELKQGIYFVKINSQQAQKVIKLVVN